MHNESHSISTIALHQRVAAFTVTFALILLCVTTQYLAHQLSYRPNLGLAVFETLYSPHKAIAWSVEFASLYPDLIARAWGVGLTSAVALVTTVASLVFLDGIRRERPTPSHTRRAVREDIERRRLSTLPANPIPSISRGST